MFQPNRLILARARRGLNKSQLAKATRITPQTVTAYETGTTTPKDDVVSRFAEALGFPPSFFYAEMIDPLPVEAASFRAFSRMTASQREVARSAGHLCVELNAWIEARFDLPPIDVPEIDPAVATPSAAASLVRAAWGFGDTPIPHMIHVLELHGVRVYSLVNESREVGAFSFWHGSTPFICLGDDKTSERSIFDAAHELGHLVMHRYWGASPRGREVEREADNFSAAFLMPAADVGAVQALRHPDLTTLIRAKKRWRVSAAALNYRLHELNLSTDWRYRDLCIELSKFGRHLEPESIQREQSQVLPKVFSALAAEGVKRGDVAEALHLPRQDLDALLSGVTLTALDGERGGEGPRRPDLRVVS